MISKTTLDKILRLFANVEEVLESRLANDVQRYEKSLTKLPFLFREYYHVLASYFLQFIVILFKSSSENDDLQLVSKDIWTYIEENGQKYYQKVILTLRNSILFFEK